MKSPKLYRPFSFLAVSLLVVSTTGCGVIFGGTTETISAMSDPESATVTVSPAAGTYTTPAQMILPRKNNYTLRFELMGYRSSQVDIQRKMRTGIVILDILGTGLIGVIVDAVTGGWYELTPKIATVTLTKIVASAPGPDVVHVTMSIDNSDRESKATISADAPGVTMRVIPQN